MSILGERYTHGHVFDFYKQPARQPDQLHVLGNGKQRKSYLYMQDCIDAIFTAIEQAPRPGATCSISAPTSTARSTTRSAGSRGRSASPRSCSYTGGDRGWIGDSPFIFLDCARMRSLGWAPKLTIREGIIRTLDYLRANPWLLESR